MSRLLVSTFIRMLKKVIFWFFVLCMFAYGVYSALNIASEARIGFVLDGCLFECLPLMGLIFCNPPNNLRSKKAHAPQRSIPNMSMNTEIM